MKWQLRFLWMKARPLTTFCLLVAVPFIPVVPWMLAAGPDPVPMPPDWRASELLSFTDPIPKGAADGGPFRGPSPPLNPAAVRKAARSWEVTRIDGGEWILLMTSHFAVRGDIRLDDLKAVGAFAERFLDAVHERLRGDLEDLRLSIRVFSQEEEFRQWASCRESTDLEAFYDRRGAEVALLYGSATDVSAFCGNLMRGVSRLYLDRAMDFRGPPHIAEEVARWFADYQVFKTHVAPRRPRRDVGAMLRIPDPAAMEAAWKGAAGGSE